MKPFTKKKKGKEQIAAPQTEIIVYPPKTSRKVDVIRQEGYYTYTYTLIRDGHSPYVKMGIEESEIPIKELRQALDVLDPPLHPTEPVT